MLLAPPQPSSHGNTIRNAWQLWGNFTSHWLIFPDNGSVWRIFDDLALHKLFNSQSSFTWFEDTITSVRTLSLYFFTICHLVIFWTTIQMSLFSWSHVLVSDLVRIWNVLWTHHFWKWWIWLFSKINIISNDEYHIKRSINQFVHIIYYIIYIYIYIYIYPNRLSHSCLWLFLFVADPVCGCLGICLFRFVVVSVCCRFGLWHSTVLVCGLSGLWLIRFWPFRFVAVMTRNQLVDIVCYGISQFHIFQFRYGCIVSWATNVWAMAFCAMGLLLLNLHWNFINN